MALWVNLGGSSDWSLVSGSYVAGVGTEIVPGGTTIYTPPFPLLLRAFTINDDSGNPLVGGGGGTTVSIGTPGFVNNILSATALATYGTTLLGWGFNGPASGNTQGEGGIVLAPAGSIPGRASLSRVLQAFANAGTITGTLRFRFEVRPMGVWS